MKLTIAQSFSTALCAGTISMTELKNFGSSSRSQESALKLVRGTPSKDVPGLILNQSNIVVYSSDLFIVLVEIRCVYIRKMLY